jgi:hypothetical protein
MMERMGRAPSPSCSGPERPGEQGRWPRRGGSIAGHRRRATGDLIDGKAIRNTR